MSIENKLTTAGFNKLQEKEDFIFFAKSTLQNKSDIEQVCIVYDKNDKKIKSVDTFLIKNDVLEVVQHNQATVQQVLQSLSS